MCTALSMYSYRSSPSSSNLRIMGCTMGSRVASTAGFSCTASRIESTVSRHCTALNVASSSSEPAAMYSLKSSMSLVVIMGAMPEMSSPYWRMIACSAPSTDSFSTSSMMRKYSMMISGSMGFSISAAPSAAINRRSEHAAAACTGSAGSRRPLIRPRSTACKVAPLFAVQSSSLKYSITQHARDRRNATGDCCEDGKGK